MVSNVIKFRLYPEGKSIYFKVFILPNRRIMRKILVDTGYATVYKAKNLLACSVTDLCGGKCYGYIVFNLEDLTERFVADELFHSVLAFGERKGILRDPNFYLRTPDPQRQREERLAEIAGELAWQFRWKCKQKGVEIK